MRAAATLQHGRFPETADTPRSPVKRSLVTADALVQRLREEGTVRVLRPDERTRAAYRKDIHAIKHGGLVPEGFELLRTGRSSGDLIVRLPDGSPEAQTEWNRIRLGARDMVPGPVGLAAMLEANPEILQVSEGERPRALRFVRSLADEADQHGHRLALSRKRQRRAYSWRRVEPQIISKPTGRLRLAPTLHHGKDEVWADNKKSRLEARLPDVVKKAEKAAREAEQRRQKAEREYAEFLAELDQEKAETESNWRAAMARARERATEEHRLRVITAVREGWKSAREIRDLCDALEPVNSGQANSAEAAEIRSWIGTSPSPGRFTVRIRAPARRSTTSPPVRRSGR